MTNDNKIIISVVVPVFNEQVNIKELYRRLFVVLENLNKSWEIVFIDDGSKDESFGVIKDLHQKDPRVKALKFSRNFGQHIAITAGINYAEGDLVILMDADLQDPPEEIPRLYEKFKEGYDIVYAIRKTRKDPFLKKLASKAFYRIFKLIGNVEISLNTGIFRIISRQAVNEIKRCREKTRFITALMDWTGFSCIGVEIERQARYSGKSKYSFFQSLKLAIDGIISFSHFPLKITTFIGFLIAVFSFLIGAYMLIQKLFFGAPILGYTSIIVSVLFLGGVQLIMIGILGEYVGRIYTEIQNRPMYIVKNKIGFSKKSAI